MREETIAKQMEREGLSRRDFLRYCTLLAAAAGMPGSARLVAETLQNKTRLPVIWLEFQDCAGCSEALTRSRSPALTDLVLNKISIDYHETLSAAAGIQAEQHKDEMMKKYSGQYVLVVEGSIPADGMHCAIGGKGAGSISHGSLGRGRGGDRHRQLRLFRRNSRGRSESHRREGSA